MVKITANSAGYVSELGTALTEKVCTDVKLVCMDGSVLCHAAVLVGAGSWWNSLLNPDEDQTVVMVGLAVEEVKKLLQLVYTGLIPRESYVDVKSTLPCLFPGLLEKVAVVRQEKHSNSNEVESSRNEGEEQTVMTSEEFVLLGDSELAWDKSMEFGMKEEIVEMSVSEAGRNQCSICFKLFKYPKDLKKHRLVHIDCTPYKCKLCNRPSKNLSNLYKHLRVFHQLSSNLKELVLDEQGRVLQEVQSEHKGKSIDPRHLDTAYVKSFGSVGLNQRGKRLYSCLVCHIKIIASSMKNHLLTHAPPQTKPTQQEKGDILSNSTLHLSSSGVSPPPTKSVDRNPQNARKRSEKVYPCRTCGKSFDSKERLTLHRRKEHKVASKALSHYPCTMCSNVFIGRRNLIRHQLSAHNLPMHCAACNKDFPSSQRFISHLEKHEENKRRRRKKDKVKSPCNNAGCDSSELNISALEPSKESSNQTNQSTEIKSNHVKRIIKHKQSSPVTSFSCGSCSATFSKKWALNKHIKSNHRLKAVEQVVCQHCKLAKKTTTFASLSLFRRHLQRHKCVGVLNPSAVQSLEPTCPVCAVDRETAMNLNQHLMSFAKVKRLECHICFKFFTTKQALRTHGLVHTGEKPFECDLCAERFTQATTLKMHIMRHQLGNFDPKNLVCGVCGKQCKNLAGFKKHVLLHANISAPVPHQQHQLHQYKEAPVLQQNIVQQYMKETDMHQQNYPTVEPQYVVQHMSKTAEYKVDHNNVQYSDQDPRKTTSVQNPEELDAPVVVDSGLFNLFMDQFQVTTINLESLERDIGCRTSLLPDKQLDKEGEYRPTPQQYTSSELTSASVTVHNHPGLHSISHVYPADITSTELQYTGQQVDYSSRETGNQSAGYAVAGESVQYTFALNSNGEPNRINYDGGEARTEEENLLVAISKPAGRPMTTAAASASYYLPKSEDITVYDISDQPVVFQANPEGESSDITHQQPVETRVRGQPKGAVEDLELTTQDPHCVYEIKVIDDTNFKM